MPTDDRWVVRKRSEDESYDFAVAIFGNRWEAEKYVEHQKSFYDDGNRCFIVREFLNIIAQEWNEKCT